MFEKEIDNYLESYADFITQKAQYREEYAEAKARLTVLIAKHVKSSASFENKVPMLLTIPEIAEEAENLNYIYNVYEAKYKNFRDFARLYEIKIIELQSRRKSQGVNGV